MKENIKNKNAVLPAGITEENIAMWKARFRKVSSITVVDGEVSYTGFFRRPDMNVISAVAAVGKDDEMRAAMVMFENCWLGGDEMMREDAVIKMAAVTKLQELMKVSQVTLKNW